MEKLQISRSERIGISSLLILILVFITLNQILRPHLQYDPEMYRQLLEEFELSSRAFEEEQKADLEKYYPDEAVSITPDPPEPSTMMDFMEEESQTAEGERLSINSASLKELTRLKGIGETYARRIIEYREANGGFKSLEELTEVKGIGKKRLDNIRPFIKL